MSSPASIATTSARTIFWAWFILLNLFATGRALYKTYVEHLPTEPYQIIWAGGVGLVQLATAAILWRKSVELRRPPWLVFAGASLLLTMGEELTCFFLKTGIFKHLDEVSAPVLFTVATGLLWVSALGCFAAYRLLALRWHHALLLFGFAGYFLEAFPFQKLYRHVPLPILLGLYPPAVAWHYMLIGMLPLLLVRPQIEPMARWDHPAKWLLALLLPLAIPTLVVLTVLS